MEKSLRGGFNTNQLRKLTNNANIQRLIAWWHYCNWHGSLKGIIHHPANSGQLAECMEKYQKRNECPEWGIEKIWNFLPPSHFLSFTELGNVQSLSGVHKVQTPILHTRLIPAPCVLIFICGEEEGQWAIKEEVRDRLKRVHAMLLAVAVLPARNQSERIPNKCG